MSDDQEKARQMLDRQKRAKDVPLITIPGYMEWSKRKVKEGESEAFIANLDALGMWMLPEEVSTVGEADFEEMLEELKAALEE